MTTNTTRHTTPAVGTWVIDPSHTTIAAVARHLMVSKVRGTFSDFSGTIQVGEDPTQSTVAVTIQAASISTGTADRDNHMRSADFLDVDNHPEITFSSTSVEPDGDNWRVTGDLTIRGVTRPVTLGMEYLGTYADPWGNQKAAFSASTRLEREQWNITWNAPLETGGVLVSKTLDVELEVQAAFQA